ncbi:MAG: GLUG motif-containing protein, partial [Candidatus Omnitrophota bacterium]
MENKKEKHREKIKMITPKILLIGALLLSAAVSNSYANPEGESVAAGSASFDRSVANTLTVNTASNNTIINYNSFNIAANETTRFNQPNAGSAVLNRVVGADPSSIYGTMSSNGKIFLVNPNGILFGPGSRVDAPAIIASTLDIANDDFLNGNYNFFKNGENAFIINQGRLASSPGGFIALLSQAVNNQGLIIADLGTVALAAGEKMTLALDNLSQISVVIDEAVKDEVLGLDGEKIDSAIDNSGIIQANGGKVILTAKVLNNVFDYAVNNSGLIQAGSIQEHDGIIEFIAEGAPVINTGSLAANTVNIKVSGADLINRGSVAASLAYGLATGNIAIEAENILQAGSVTAEQEINFTATQDITTDPVVNSNPAVIIQGKRVNLSARQFGTTATPLNIRAENINLDRIQGDINILNSLGIGTSMLLRGPPQGFGAIIYNPDTNLTLEAPQGAINISSDVTLSANNLTLTANNAITNNGSIIVTGIFNLLSNGNITNAGLIRFGTLIEKSYHFTTTGTLIGGLAYIEDIDGAGNYGGVISANITDAGDINLTSNITLAANNLVFTAGGAFIANGFSINSDTGTNYNLTINAGVNSSLGPVGDTQPLGSLTLNGGGVAVFSVSGSITVTGAINLTSNITLAANNLVFTAGGAFIANGFSINSDTATNYNLTITAGADSALGTIGNTRGPGILTLNAGTASFTAYGSITTTGNINLTSNIILMADNLVFTAGGAFAASGLSINSNTGVNYNLTIIIKTNSALGPIGNSQPLGNLTLIGSVWYGGPTFTMNGNMTLAGNLTLGNGTDSRYGVILAAGVSTINIAGNLNNYNTFNAENSVINIAGNLNINITISSSTFNAGNSTINLSGNWANGGGYLNGGTSTVNFGNTSAAQSISGTNAFNNITIDKGAQVLTLGGALTINGNLTLASGTFSSGANAITIKGNWTNNGGTFIPGTGTVTFNNTTVAQAINGTALAHTFNHIVVAKTAQTLSVASPLTVNGNLTLTSGIFDLGTSSITAPGAANTLSVGATCTISVGTASFSGSYSGFETVTLSTGSTVKYALAGDQTIAALAYSNLQLSNGFIKSLEGAVTINGILTIDAGTTLASGGFAINIKGNWIDSGLFSAQNNTVTFSGTTAQSLTEAGSFFNLIIASGSTVNILANPLSVTGDLTVDGTLDIQGNSLTVTGIFALNNTLKLTGDSPSLSVPTMGIGATVAYTATSGSRPIQNWSYYNLTISGAGGTFISDPTQILSVANSFIITAGAFNRFTGTGTALDPYLIYDVYGLQGMKGYLTAYFKLNNDIDAAAASTWNAGKGFSPVGNNTTKFSGSFDGNNKIISGLYIKDAALSYAGLFGATNNSLITNVGLVNAYVEGASYIGGLAGSITNSTITNSYVTGTVKGTSNIGGLIGYVGVVSSISNSYSSAAVTGSTAGGLVGSTGGYPGNSTITNCYATGAVTGGGSVGGLVGYNYSNTISKSYATGTVTGTSNDVGGLVGNNASIINNSYATGNVTAANSVYVGGLAGHGGTINNSYATGIVAGKENVGGLAGYGATITNSHATGNVSGSSYGVGGLLGYSYFGLISNSYATGNVTGTGTAYTGGLVGMHQTGTITNSYATGNVNMTSASTYACGGGLVGWNGGTITYSYSTGAVTGTVTKLGGLIGTTNGGTFTSNYWLKDAGINSTLSDATLLSNGAPTDLVGVDFKTNAELQQAATFVGWSFDNIWTMDLNPAFQWQHFVWDGEGLTNNWSEALNWNKDIVPGAADKVFFNSTSTKNSTIDALGASILRLQISSLYTDTITQANNLNVASDYVQLGGTFRTSSYNLAVAGNFSNTGIGMFDAGIGTVEFNKATGTQTL